jgi:hypothetical protein
MGHFDAGCQLAHHRGGGNDFINGFAFGAQPGQETANLYGRGAARHDLLHDRRHFLAAEVDAVNDIADSLFDVHSSTALLPLWRLAAWLRLRWHRVAAPALPGQRQANS